MRVKDLLSLPIVCLTLSIAIAQSGYSKSDLIAENGTLKEPESRPILRVSGNIKVSKDGTTAFFDYAQLKTFKQHELKAKRPWFDDERTHTGPLLKDVLDFLQAKEANLKVIAHNSYTNEIPYEDIRDIDILLAIDKDGMPMRVRDKGPVYITYPFEDNPELQDERYYGRSVWMLKSIEVQ